MKAYLIEEEADFKGYYPYTVNNWAGILPEQYPCLMLLTDEGGGLCGEYIKVTTITIPTHIVKDKDYFEGFVKAVQLLR